jgi:hypothetical protein
MYWLGLLATAQKLAITSVAVGAAVAMGTAATGWPPVRAKSVAYANVADSASTHSQGKTQRAAPNTA